MQEIQHTAAQAGLEGLKSDLATTRTIREADAKSAESAIRDKAGNSGNPLAKIQAELQIGAIHRQTAQQNLADDAAEHAAADRLLQDEINGARAGSTAYIHAVDAKKLADQQWANHHRVLLDQMVNQEKVGAQQIAQAWHSHIDPMVQSTGNMLKGLVNGTETWHQALLQIGNAIEDTVISAIEKMAEDLIVNLIMGQTQQTMSAQGMIASNAAVAGSAGVASMAGAPFPMDLTAPEFGASMAMAASAFSVGGFAKGIDVVPQDMIALIHQGERVVPASDNAALISASSANGVRGGVTHHHHTTVDASTTINGTAHPDVIANLETRKRNLARLLKGLHRDGHF
ncbi:MAG TPA: hypothetical protein VGI79_07110 [Caulobacteraceae bacterium]|jgi:hypothetical protein